MSTPRSPNEIGSVTLLCAAVATVLIIAWLMANLIIGVYQILDYLEELLWL